MNIRDHPFFEDVDPDVRERLVNLGTEHEYPNNQVIFEEGSPSEDLCLVLEGAVAFCKEVSNSDYRVVGYSREGEFFGEIGLFTGQPRALRAEARGKVNLGKIPKSAMVEYITSTPGPIANILESIVNHLHETTRHYLDDMLHQEKMAVVGTMVNTIFHDLKNPFTLIKLAAEVIEGRTDDRKTGELCRTIEEQIQRMVLMADELNDFSRGLQTLQPAAVNVRDMVSKFRELNAPYFQDERLRFEISVPDLTIEAEENKLLRVLQNLVSNAIDAFRDGEGTISIKAAREGERIILLEISDNGDGIPPSIRPNLFDPFVTLGKSRGTGLGTSIVKSIVEAHGGKIEFETETGKGTKFSIRLPTTQGDGTKT